jgi:hypothetical protein
MRDPLWYRPFVTSDASERAPIVARSRQTESSGFFILGGVLIAAGGASIAFEVKKLLGLIIIGWLFVLAGLWMRHGEKRDQKLHANGIPGSAKITKTETVRVKKDGDTGLRLSLTVDLPGQVPYSTTANVWTNQAEVPRIVQLTSVAVRVDPEDKHRVLIVWS